MSQAQILPQKYPYLAMSILVSLSRYAGVGVLVRVEVGLFVGVGVCVGVWVNVAVWVGVTVGIKVAVFVAVEVFVSVGENVSVGGNTVGVAVSSTRKPDGRAPLIQNPASAAIKTPNPSQIIQRR